MRKRLALVGQYNTRPGTLVLSGTSGIVGIGIVGLMIVGNPNSGSGKDHRLINCFQITESDETARSKRLYLVKRPGLAAALTSGAAAIGNAIHVWTGQGSGQKVMSCFGATNSTLYDSTTSKGAITGKATSITETSISATPTLTIPSSDSTLWYYQDGGSATKVADADYPGNAGRTMTGPVSHIDGYAVQMDTGARLGNSDLNSITAWTAGAYITASKIPDVGVAAILHGNTIVGFCKEHFEVFRNAGNPSGSPLSRIDELTQKIGCISADAIAEVRDIVYFVGSSKEANVALYAYAGAKALPISTPEIDAQLAIAGPANISLATLGFYGRHFVVISAASSTFVYCIEENDWHEWNSTTRLWYKADGVSIGGAIVNYVISKDSTGGKVFVINPSNIVYQDDGAAYTATFQTAKLDFGTAKWKFLTRLDVIGDQVTGSTLNIAYYDDDYQTASAARSVDMSIDNPNLTRLGKFKRRAFVLSHAVNTAMRLEALELDFEVGT